MLVFVILRSAPLVATEPEKITVPSPSRTSNESAVPEATAVPLVMALAVATPPVAEPKAVDEKAQVTRSTAPS